MSMLKLASFHGLFAWLTFRMFGAPLAYTSAVASAAFALLPFVPTYSVALPGCAVVAFQGRVAAAVALLILHFSAYYIGDSVVLGDSGGHPFMMSLAILGGLWAFSNPLLGCLLGPTLLSLLSALGELHTELMGASAGGKVMSPTGPTGIVRRPSQLILTTPEGGSSQLKVSLLQGGDPRQVGGISPREISPRHHLNENISGSVPQSPMAGSCGSREEASPRGRGVAVSTSASVSMSLDELPNGTAAGVGSEVTSGERQGESSQFSFPKSPSKRRENVTFDPKTSEYGL